MSDTTDSREIAAQALAAAGWWADAIRAPKHDNGDALFNALARFGTDARSAPSDDQIEAFTDHLARTISDLMGHATWTITLGVDYGPDRELSDAATAAGIQSRDFLFPVKTCMWIKPGANVTVSRGYRAADQTIWEAQ